MAPPSRQVSQTKTGSGSSTSTTTTTTTTTAAANLVAGLAAASVRSNSSGSMSPGVSRAASLGRGSPTSSRTPTTPPGTKTTPAAGGKVTSVKSPSHSIDHIATTPQSATFSHAAAFALGRPGSASAVNRRRSEQAFASSPVEAHHHHHHPHPFHASVFEEDGVHPSFFEDDEHDKGHGGAHRRPSGRWTPTVLSNMLRLAEGRFSPVNTFTNPARNTSPTSGSAHAAQASPSTPAHKPASPRFKVMYAEPDSIEEDKDSARRTPVAYRPAMAETNANEQMAQVHSAGAQPASATTSVYDGAKSTSGYYPPASAPVHFPPSSVSNNTMQHPLSHSHKLSMASNSSASSHSIQMHSPKAMSHSRHASVHKPAIQPSPILAPAGGASPLVVPQARRGAVNLRSPRRRRKASQRCRKGSPGVPIHKQLFSFLQLFVWSLCHPLSAARRANAFVSTTLCNIDHAFRDPRTHARVWRPAWLGAYIPLLIWLVVSLSSTFTVLIWHTEVFQALDRLSAHLQSLGLRGRLILGFLIFITTFPPLPLYSTLIILCGFSFGLVQGFIISYIAALSGAIVVFLLSRSLLKGWMVKLLNQSGGLKKVVRAIEKRPKLLFLVRLAPYPYNLMNTLLASSPTLTFKTYTVCTALALPKLVVHCGLGTTIKNFAAYNGAAHPTTTSPLGSDEKNASKAGPVIGNDLSPADLAKAGETAELIKHVFGFVGVGLCVGIFLYLFSVARRAVDEELDEDELGAEEYELVLSGDEDSVDGLDNDDLNIAGGASIRNGSGESTRIGEEGSGSQRTSSQIGHSSPSPHINGRGRTTSAGMRAHGSEATLVDGRLSIVNKGLGAGDGSTPLYIASSNGMNAGGVHGDGSGASAPNASYFGGWNGHAAAGTSSSSSSHRVSVGSRRYMESQSSLADSIVEMEKHANAIHPDDDEYATPAEQRHDISIEVPSSANASRNSTIKGQRSARGKIDYGEEEGGGEGNRQTEERQRLI